MDMFFNLKRNFDSTGLEEIPTTFIIVNPDCSSIITTPPSPHGGLVLFRSFRKYTLETIVTNIMRYDPSLEKLVMRSDKPYYRYDVEFVEDENGLIQADGILEGITGFPAAVRAVLRRTTQNLANFVLHLHPLTHAERCAYIKSQGMRRVGSIFTVEDPEEEEEDDDTCSVCIEKKIQVGKEILVLSCGHSFHIRCIAEWFEEKTKCPLCQGHVLPIHALAAAWKLQN